MECYSVCRQRPASRKMQHAKKARTDRLINHLEQRAVGERRRAERYKKRYQRVLKKLEQKARSPATQTPRTQTHHLLRYMNVSEHVRRTLTFHNAVINNLRSRYRKCKSQRKIRNLIMGRTIHQCKMQMFCREVFGFSSRAKVVGIKTAKKN